jgi:hypothetical protein
MNCKTFHRNLEDYLEGGLDFSGRFGMERHAQQCIGCGKEMSDAQRLRRLVSDLQRVKAPANFEASVLREIGARKAHDRFSGFRSLWVYGLEWSSFRKLALASSFLAILCFGVFYSLHRASFNQAYRPPQIAGQPAAIPVEVKEARTTPGTRLEVPLPKKQAAGEIPKLAKRVRPQEFLDQEPAPDQDLRDLQEVKDMDYVEYVMPGPNSRPVPVRLPLPKVIPMRYGQMSEEYFIRNVSH